MWERLKEILNDEDQSDNAQKALSALFGGLFFSATVFLVLFFIEADEGTKLFLLMSGTISLIIGLFGVVYILVKCYTYKTRRAQRSPISAPVLPNDTGYVYCVDNPSRELWVRDELTRRQSSESPDTESEWQEVDFPESNSSASTPQNPDEPQQNIQQFPRELNVMQLGCYPENEEMTLPRVED